MNSGLSLEQKKAIGSRNRALIVSAAAGAGKTTVLTQRVVGLVCDEHDPCSLDSLLVVTFTNAAAAEMRGRVADALTRALAENPKNHALRRQLALMGESKIQTIHSFCQNLIRENFSMAGVSPDFTLCDELLAAEYKNQAMEALLEEAYEENSPNFLALRNNICEERGDSRLQKAVLTLFDKLQGHPNPRGWLEYIASRTISSPMQTMWGAAVINGALSAVDYGEKAVTAAFEELQGHPALMEKYGKTLLECTAFAQSFFMACKEGWDGAFAALASFKKPEFARAPAGYDKKITDKMKSVRDEFWEIVKSVEKSGLSRSEASILQEEEQAKPIIAELCRLVLKFEEIYSGIKRRGNRLDFNDLEHITLGLLVDEKGDSTPLAREIQSGLREVLVDEYQDTNAVQEAILAALTEPDKSAFFVGDVKQSIYGFRLADAKIFVDRLESSHDIDGQEERRAKLALSRNYRSSRAVIETCNHVFSRLMCKNFGNIDYSDSHSLIPVREEDFGPCELLIVETEGLKDNDEDSDDKLVYEARLIGEKIAEIMENDVVIEKDGTKRPPVFSDFAIILSTVKNKAYIFAQQLRLCNIDVAYADDSDFFATIEMSVMTSLLRTIDNRRQDIPLVSIMRSPVFGFSSDDLARIRHEYGGDDMCSCLEAAAEDGDEKAIRLLDFLGRFSSLAADLPVSKLLLQLYVETHAKAIFGCLENGARREENLDSLYQMALNFERGGGSGLYGFVGHLDRLIENGQSGGKTDSGGVEILSIHRSKGLEFPFVFLPDLSKNFNLDDTKAQTLFHLDMGIGIKLRNFDLRTETKTVAYKAISSQISKELVEEEARKLYVAMTRAKQRLFMILSKKNSAKFLNSMAKEGGGRLHHEFSLGQKDSGSWLCAALLSHKGAAPLRSLCHEEIAPDPQSDESYLGCRVVHWQDIKPVKLSRKRAEKRQEMGDYSSFLADANKEYSHIKAASFPSKLTPSGKEFLAIDGGEIYWEHRRPVVTGFPRATPQSAQTAALRGTALHNFLKILEYNRGSDPQNVENQLLSAVMGGYISSEMAKEVDVNMIINLLKSPLKERITSAETCLREYNFSALFKAEELIENGPVGEDVLINGSIDLLLINDQTIEIIDFKSDYVAKGQEDEKAKEHAFQLELYAKAAKSIFQAEKVEKTVFFLRTGAQVAL